MKPFRTLVLCCIALLFLVASASAEYRKTKIAVLDFQQNGIFQTPDVGKIVAEWFTTALVETGRFDIIERRLLQQLLDEQKMGQSGLIDPTSASRLGKVLGVSTVVSGTVQNYDGNYEINARLINVESGAIIVAEKVHASSAGKLTELVASIATRIIHNFPLQGYVVQRNDGRVLIDLGRQAGVRPGMQFSAYVEGKQIRHPRTRELLDVERKEQGLIRIDDVKDKISGGVIVRENSAGTVKSGIMVRGVLAEDEQQREEARIAVAEKAERQEQERSEKEQRDRQSANEAKNKGRESKHTPPPPVTVAIPSPIRTLTEHTGDVKSIAFSEDGALAASGDKDKVAIVWDTRDWSKVATLKGHRNDVQALSFKHKGRFLVSGGKDDSAMVWDLARSAQVALLKTDKDVNAVDYNPAGTRLATGSNAREVIIWDTANWNRVRTLKTGGDVLALSYSPDGSLLAAGGKEKVVRIWRADDTESSGRLLEGHGNDVSALAFSPGGSMLVTGGEDKSIIIWNVSDGSIRRRLEGHENSIVGLGISRDGHRLVSAESRRSEGTLIVWDMNNGRESRRIKVEHKIEAMALSPDGRFVLIGKDRSLLLYRLD